MKSGRRVVPVQVSVRGYEPTAGNILVSNWVESEAPGRGTILAIDRGLLYFSLKGDIGPTS